MPPSIPLLQERFEEAINADSDVLYVGYSGSIARETYDKYSDLDLEVWLTDSAFQQGETRWRQIPQCLGEVKLNYSDHFLDRAFIGSDWLRVDMRLHQSSELKPDPQLARPKVLLGYDEVLRHTGEKLPNYVTEEQRPKVDICNAIDSQIYIASKNARGQTDIALVTVNGCRNLLRLRLNKSRTIHNADFPDVERSLMQAAELTSSTKEECRRAARALWDWTRYVWAEAEHHLGKSFQITLDDEQFLSAVNARYLW